MFVLWRRLKEDDRRRVWLLYGWFSRLMCVGSVSGAVAWAAWMQCMAAFFSGSAPGLTQTQTQSLLVQQNNAEGAFAISSAIEFVCLSVAKLMVLERMANFAVAKGDDLLRRVAVGGRVVMAAAVVGNAVIFCSSIAAAVFFKEASIFNSASGAAYAANNVEESVQLGKQASQKYSEALLAISVQQFSEVTVLLIIIFAFSVVGVASARRVSSALRNINDEHEDVTAAGRQLRRQIVGTTAFVFVTFLLRAVFTSKYALARALQNADAACAATASSYCDSACFNQWRLIDVWIGFTPEYQAMVILISSPVAMIVALWGMTGKRALQLMKSSGKQSAAARDDLEQVPVGLKGKGIAMAETAVVIRK
jgi:hypothetical protein